MVSSADDSMLLDASAVAGDGQEDEIQSAA